MSGCGARTTAGSLEAVFESSDGERFVRGSLVSLDNDDLNLPGLDVLQQPLERRPLHRPARQASIVIHIGKREPSGMTLAHDVGLASLPLCVERIEFLLEALVGRFSGVDRAADGGPGSCEIRAVTISMRAFRMGSM